MNHKLQQTYHFIGIGGMGMSGLARILLQQKKQVSGSDLVSNYVIEALKLEGAKVHIGHSKDNINPHMTVIVSSDIQLTNPEVVRAQELHLPIMHRSDLLLSLMNGFKPLAVAGTHGKTTTSALLTTVFNSAHWDPTFALGGILKVNGSNAGYGRGQYFIAEVDESDGTFLKYPFCAAIVTNIDCDHMNFYHTKENLIEAFLIYMKKAPRPDLLFYCIDDPILSSLSLQGVGYGISQDAPLRASSIRQEGWKMIYNIDFRGVHYKDIEISLIGEHNVLNSLAVFGLCISLGVPEEIIRSAFLDFKGVARRLDIKGTPHGVLVIDDYAHHPTEIRTTIAACRKAVGNKKIFVVYQPHRYSRMAFCLGQFHQVFDEADELIVTDLYSAGEHPIPGISSERIFKDIKNSNILCSHFLPKQNVISQLLTRARPHDVILMLGAGDINRVAAEAVEAFHFRGIRKIQVGIVCGGMSCEHEVSLASAQFIINNLDPSIYKVEKFVVSKEGYWESNLEEKPTFSVNSLSWDVESRICEATFRKINQCDVFIPVFHGPYGEDGVPQGFFEMLGKPYVGCDHRSSAIAMDKALTKHIAKSLGIPTASFKSFDYYTWTQQRAAIIEEVSQKFSCPIFVKPTHLGSSVAISKVERKVDLADAIDQVFAWDTHVLIESAIVPCREIEFALLGNENIIVPDPGEIPAQGRFYDYVAKYGEMAIEAVSRASLTPKQMEEGRYLAEIIYRTLGCQGLARVDFFLDHQGKYWFNEVNPFPGFTETSLYPKVWENRMSARELIDNLIILAFSRQRACKKVFGSTQVKKLTNQDLSCEEQKVDVNQ